MYAGLPYFTTRGVKSLVIDQLLNKKAKRVTAGGWIITIAVHHGPELPTAAR